ncbi:hypothetical protein ACH4D5_26130 [Streptomyces sp. NPDC018029]|uniref:hypothetical protein n=1 Tax=Streptomyces sp. NPDC018029 TaxID=3365032 RepID=UPI0037B33BA2
MLAIIVAVGAVIAVVLVATGDDSDGKKEPAETSKDTTPEPTPSLSIPSQIPTELPTGLPSEVPSLPTDMPSLPTDFPSLPTDFPSGLDSLQPSPPADGQVPYTKPQS